ncbi:ERI1 exoribonuclease 3 [Halotydeus destructor]|nr:ERI1 exoribonuclease 3 [Halotydeus destructor]
MTIHQLIRFPTARSLIGRSILTKPTKATISNRMNNNNSYTSKKNTSMRRSRNVEQTIEFFLVLDLEATCDSPSQPDPMEVIEFPVLMVNSSTFRVESAFHSFVRPQVNPRLSDYCTKLTGIVQQTVDESPPFQTVFRDFQEWMETETGLICPQSKRHLRRFAFATCGNWDFQMMLQDECSRLKLPVPTYMRSWIDVKRSFSDTLKRWPKSLNDMMVSLQIEPVGRAHSGQDDCANLVQIMKQLADHGCVFRNTNVLW